MILKITKKEYARIKRLQDLKFYDCLLFKLPDGSTYKCSTMAGLGLKEIRHFQLEQSKSTGKKKELLELQGMLL